MEHAHEPPNMCAADIIIYMKIAIICIQNSFKIYTKPH